MLGAIIGDIVGSQYEWRNNKSKNFTFFTGACHYTDDSLMTLAIAQAFTLRKGRWREPGFQKFVVEKMVEMGKAHQACSWGKSFYDWFMYNPVPYNSYGNGSAMRVSSVGWISESEEDVIYFSRLVTEVSHNHPEGIKGAEATASAIFLARTGSSKSEIKAYIEENFHYDLSRTCDEIRPAYRHVESCQETVPEAITAFLEGRSFEDVIRTAVSLGGDCDTLTCIAGSIAEGYYGVPEELKQQCRERLPEDLRKVLRRFEKTLHS